MATLTTLIQRVKDLLDDSSIADSKITAHLNDAQLELAQLSHTLTVWPVSVASGAQSVTKPTAALLIKEIYFDYDTLRTRLDIGYGIPPETSSVTGYPERAYVVGDQIYLHPVPLRSGTLQVVGVARPVDMSQGTDTPGVNDADSVLVAYAAWMIALSDEDDRTRGLGEFYKQKRAEWSILNAQASPMPRRIEREWPW